MQWFWSYYQDTPAVEHPSWDWFSVAGTRGSPCWLAGALEARGIQFIAFIHSEPLLKLVKLAAKNRNWASPRIALQQPRRGLEEVMDLWMQFLSLWPARMALDKNGVGPRSPPVLSCEYSRRRRYLCRLLLWYRNQRWRWRRLLATLKAKKGVTANLGKSPNSRPLHARYQ